MESIHGVDVSWLHRSTRDPSVKPENAQPASNSTPKPSSAAPAERETQPTAQPTDAASDKVTSRSPPKPPQEPPGIPTQNPAKTARRSGILGRLSSSDKLPGASPVSEETKAKRTSWRSSISSKFSAPAPSDRTPSPGRSPKTSYFGTVPRNNSADSASQAIEEGPEDELATLGVSPPAKSGGSFFSSALRRISSTAPQQPSLAIPEHSLASPRKLLNVDEGRDRPAIKELKESRLRRVAFSVDVEIAGSSRYPVEESAVVDDDATKKANKKEKKVKERAEGEAFKRPNLRKGESAGEGGLLHALGRDGMFDIGVSDPDPLDDANDLGPSSPPEKPKLKPPKEKSPPQPEPAPAKSETSQVDQRGRSPVPESGSKLPIVSTTTVENDSAAKSAKPATKSNDRPTTDPLRIYRRCCQLREAPVLKRISEQLGNPENYAPDSPGVVSCLNLTKSRMQLPDIVCLGDWLAVVPVKKLLLEDANLTDEAVRIILAGLLAAKLPELHRRKRGRSSPSRLREHAIIRSPGVVEKLTLSNNKKLTAEAWKHISLFINMSRSIKAVDVSMIPLPKIFAQPLDTGSEAGTDPVVLLAKSIAERHGGDRLEELIFGECELNDHQVDKITEAAVQIKLKRLGLAGNHLDQNALDHVARYLSSNVCKGLDIGGNDLRQHLPIVAKGLHSKNPIQAVCLANCNLEVASLEPLFPALVVLPDLRFLDLSQNKQLFAEKPTALGILRKYLPQIPVLKRLHLMGVSMSPADAIGLAEILPEMRNIAHLSILENPELAKVVHAKDSASQEEACALYASIMTAVRLSKMMICVDIDVPDVGASEVVKALARQTFAYCLRNMERFSDDNIIRMVDAGAALPDLYDADIDFLPHIAGPTDGDTKTDELYAPERQEDFMVGGQGWIKALSHCLNARDFRRVSVGGDITPSQVMDSPAGRAQAKEVSKTLLVSARNFRVRLNNAIAREQKGVPDDEVMRRMLFLRHALDTMIERFEQEYPDTKVPNDISSTGQLLGKAEKTNDEVIDGTESPSGSRSSSDSRRPSVVSEASTTSEHASTALDDFFDNEPQPAHNIAALSRRASEVEIHNRVLAQEEGKMHKIGQKFRRDVLPPSGQTDYLHGTSEKDAPEPEHLARLRRQLEEFGGEEIRERYNKVGLEGILKELKFGRFETATPKSES